MSRQCQHSKITETPTKLPSQQGKPLIETDQQQPDGHNSRRQVAGQRISTFRSGESARPMVRCQLAAPPALGRGAVSLNFDDADIYSVIQTVFSEILKFSYIIDPRVKGRVTFRSIAPVPRDNVLPLMEVILEAERCCNN